MKIIFIFELFVNIFILRKENKRHETIILTSQTTIGYWMLIIDGE